MRIVNGLKLYSHEEVLEKLSKKHPGFMKGYNEELTRILMSGEIKQARKQSKMTQAQVAKKAKMPQSVIARMESGQHSISLDTLNRIAHALGKKVQLV